MIDGGFFSDVCARARACVSVFAGPSTVFAFASPDAAESRVITLINVRVCVCVCFHSHPDAAERTGNVVLTGVSLQRPTG